jgi:DNA-binding NarL/FixJ family response regulator
VSDVRVLVVDDQELFRQTVAAVVAATDGFEVVGSVGSGEDSLTVAADDLPDLVLMDVNLPGIDGLEAARRLQSVAPRPVVLLLSAYDEGELDYLSCGAAGYVAKSAFGPDRLLEAWTAAREERGPNQHRELP